MSKTGICSRREAEQMIADGLVFVDGKKVHSNISVSLKNDIKIFTQKGEKVPMKQDTKLYIFYKPRGLICSTSDPLGRPTIYDYLKKETKLQADHIISVGRLDFNSEGLLLLTNNGELASMLENPMSDIRRQYRVRVQGKLDEIKLLKIRGGAIINEIQYGPFEAEIDSRQSTNTWLRIGMYQGKNREIRRVMQKYDLRVSRLKREQYGSYKIGKMVPGDIHETLVFKEIKRKFYLHLRKKFEGYNQDLRQMLTEKYGEDIEYIEDKDLTEEERRYLANSQYDPNDKTYYLKDSKQNQKGQKVLMGNIKKTHRQLLLQEPKIIK